MTWVPSLLEHANLRETREADQRALRLRNENAYETALKILKFNDARQQCKMFDVPTRTAALLLTGATLAELTAFRTSQLFRKEITKLTGADDTASLICMGADDSTATSSLKGMQIRFASPAMATEARAALIKLQPTRIWPAFVVGNVPEQHYQTNRRGNRSRISLSGKTVPAAVPSARSQNAKVSAK